MTLARAKTIELPTHRDARGCLTAIESGTDVPFTIHRIFYLYQVAEPFERGGHAHPTTEQLLICMHSSMRVDLMDGVSCETFTLSRPDVGLYVPAMVWTRLYDFTPETVLMVAASTHYDEPTVIRRWDEYVERLPQP